MKPARLYLGGVLVVPATLSNPAHASRIAYPEKCGRERVAALTAWRAGTLSPTLAVWFCPTAGGAFRITPDQVDWSGSRIPAPDDPAPVEERPAPAKAARVGALPVKAARVGAPPKGGLF